MAENIHENHILRHSFVPTGLVESLKQQAADMARLSDGTRLCRSADIRNFCLSE